MGVSAKPVAVQFHADGAHAAVHHVAGRHQVGAGLGVAGGGAGEQFQRGIVQDFAALHHAAMAVLHVFAQAHVGDDEQRRQFLFQQPHGLLDDAVFRVGAARPGRLFGRGCRTAGRPGRRACGRGWLRAGVRRAKTGTRRAWHGWGGGRVCRSGRTVAARVARRADGFRPRAGARRAIAAAGAGD